MPANDLSGSFDRLRNRLLNDLLLATGIMAVPSLLISLSRISIMGFKPFMAIQIVLVISVWLIWINAQKLPYLFRTTSLLILFWVATFAALSQIGPASDSKVFMIFFAFTCILFLKSRIAWLLVVGMVVSMAVFGYVVVQRWIVFDLDYQVYSHHPLAWAITTWNMGIFSAVVAYMGWRMIGGLRHQSEMAEELASRLQKIAERVPGVVYQFKLSQEGISSFPYTSEGVREMFRVTPEQVKFDAGPMFKSIHPDDREQVIQSITESGEKLIPWRLEYRTLFADGTVRWVSGDSSPQKELDGSILWHGFIMDITERKNIERLKDEFVATVSHELRTPLTSIRGSIQLINSGVLKGQDEKIKQMLSIAEVNSERLLLLINDLLNMEKMVNGSFVLEISRFALKPFLIECIEENMSYAQQCSTSITLTGCDEFELSADRQRMKQVMANLISNACKYSPPQVAVEVSAARHSDSVEIRVTDFGSGIPKDFQDKVFENFSQADGSDTRQFGGTGLGLPIVKNLVELHQGSVSFTSEEGVTTTFLIKLPI